MSEEIESTDAELQGDEIEIVQPIETERDRINNVREQELLDEVAEAGQVVTNEPSEPEKVAPPQAIKVKIDGQESDVSMEDLVRAYQKSESGDRRLQQAAYERQQLDRERQEFEQQRQQAQQNQPAQRNSTINDLLSQRRDAMEIGDYDEFDRLDDEIANIRLNESHSNVVSEATQQMRVQVEYEKELNSFTERNPLIAGNAVLNDMAMSTFRQACATSSTYAEAFAATEQAMTSWIETIAPSAKDSGMTDREARKQAIPQQPTGRVNAKSSPAPVEKEQTASEIIAGMRKERGLPV